MNGVSGLNWSNETVDADARIKIEKDAKEIFTNQIKTGDIDIIKVDVNDEDTKLEGAEFELRRFNPVMTETNYTVDEKTLEVTSTTVTIFENGITTADSEAENGIKTVTYLTSSKTGKDDGKTGFTDLLAGYYEVKEIKTPDGYVLTNGGKFYIKVEGGVVYLIEFKRNLKKKENADDPDEYVYEWVEVEEKTALDTTTGLKYTAAKEAIVEGEQVITPATLASVTVGNTPGKELPHTGGSGIIRYTVAGLGCITVPTAVLIYRKKKEDEENNND